MLSAVKTRRRNEFLIPRGSLSHNPKSASKRRRTIVPDDVTMCQNGTIEDLHGIYTERALALSGSEMIVTERKFYGCSQCAKTGLKGVCGCNRGFCSVCEGKCFVCRRIQHVSSLSKPDAIHVVTHALREVLMQVCTLAREQNPNEVLLGNLASRILQARVCLNLLNKM
jgi:hypothetical protein